MLTDVLGAVRNFLRVRSFVDTSGSIRWEAMVSNWSYLTQCFSPNFRYWLPNCKNFIYSITLSPGTIASSPTAIWESNGTPRRISAATLLLMTLGLLGCSQLPRRSQQTAISSYAQTQTVMNYTRYSQDTEILCGIIPYVLSAPDST